MGILGRGIRKATRSTKGDVNEIRGALGRIKRRDFSGDSGQAIKNSTYQLASSVISRAGALIFAIIIARMLLPELFGLYSMALSIILIFSVFSELGISQAVVRFIAKESGKKNGKVIEVLKYLLKIKLILIAIVVLALAILSPIIAGKIYDEPILLALFSGILYIIFLQLVNFAASTLQGLNNFKLQLIREIIFSVLKITLMPIAILIGMKFLLSTEIRLALIILSIAISFLVPIPILINSIKKYEVVRKKCKKTTRKEKKKINKFIIASATIALSGVFFANIDKIMMGYFASASFVGYYTAAVSLISSIVVVPGIFSVSLLPIFSKLKTKDLGRKFKRVVSVIILISAILFIFTNALAYIIIILIYGKAYLTSVSILRALSILIFINPIIGIYSAYFISRGSPKIIAKSTLFATVINIILNFIFMKSLTSFGEIYIVYAAVAATLISQVIYMIQLINSKKD